MMIMMTTTVDWEDFTTFLRVHSCTVKRLLCSIFRWQRWRQNAKNSWLPPRFRLAKRSTQTIFCGSTVCQDTLNDHVHPNYKAKLEVWRNFRPAFRPPPDSITWSDAKSLSKKNTFKTMSTRGTGSWHGVSSTPQMTISSSPFIRGASGFICVI